MEKRGLSGIVYSILVILLILAAIVIIWAFVRPALIEGSGNVEPAILTARIEVVEESINFTSNKVELLTKRYPGIGDIVALFYTLEDINGNKKRYEVNNTNGLTLPFSELETRKTRFTFSSFDFNGKIKQICVSPIVLNKDGRRLIHRIPNCVNVENEVGNTGLGGICNNGDLGDYCSKQEGVCAGSREVCVGGVWPECSATNYGSSYEINEVTCDGVADNDCDGLPDEIDPNCEEEYTYAGCYNNLCQSLAGTGSDTCTIGETCTLVDPSDCVCPAGWDQNNVCPTMCMYKFYCGGRYPNSCEFIRGECGCRDNPSCPVITLGGTVPGGIVGVAYSASLSASPGSNTFSIASGGLPPGLGLSGGSISGTPTTAGTYSFNVKATDGDGCTGNKGYTIVIEEGGVPTSCPGALSLSYSLSYDLYLNGVFMSPPSPITCILSGSGCTWSCSQGTLSLIAGNSWRLTMVGSGGISAKTTGSTPAGAGGEYPNAGSWMTPFTYYESRNIVVS